MSGAKPDWLGLMARHPANLLGIKIHKANPKPTTSENNGIGDNQLEREI